MRRICVGSRESRLAVIQSEMVMEYLKKTCPGDEITLLTMKTTGDKILDRTLDKVGGKGLFVKELDRALLSGRTDLSVHSLKDMPMEISEELPIVAYSRREDPRDVLVLPAGVEKVDFQKPIGCSACAGFCSLRNCSSRPPLPVSGEMYSPAFPNWTRESTELWCWRRLD